MKKTLLVLLLLGNSLTTLAGEVSGLKQSYIDQKLQVKAALRKLASKHPAAAAEWVEANFALAQPFLTDKEKIIFFSPTFANHYCLTPSYEQECEYVFKNMTAGAYLLADYEQKIENLD